LVAFGQYAVRDLFWNDKVISGNEAHVYFRVNSLFFDPNIMGRYLALTMVALGGVVAWGRRRESGLASIVFLMLLLALAITFSQSSMLALLAGLLVLIAGRWGIAGGLVAGVATLLVLAISIVAFGEAGITDETTGRRGLVSGGLELAEQQPVVGNGSGSFPVEFEERFGGGDGIATESHTEPITVLAEQGAVGMIPYLLLLAAAVTMLWSAAGVGLRGMRNPVGATLLATFAAMVVHSLGYAAFLTDPLTWLILALAAVLPAMYSSAVEPGRTAAAEPQRV
jgi:O-antigen ligase